MRVTLGRVTLGGAWYLVMAEPALYHRLRLVQA